MMARNVVRQSFVNSALILLLAPTCFADEAMRLDGRRITGTLSLDQTGRLQFFVKDLPEPMTEVQHIRFSDIALTQAPFAAPLLVQLSNGQSVSGELLELDSNSLNLRTQWSERLALPRRAVVSL